MRLLNQMLNLSRIFDCLSRRFGKVVFNLKMSNLVHSDVPTQSSYLSHRHMWNSTFKLGNRELKNHDEVHDDDVCCQGKDWNENVGFGGKKET